VPSRVDRWFGRRGRIFRQRQRWGTGYWRRRRQRVRLRLRLGCLRHRRHAPD